MKTTLILVGKTRDKLYTHAIDDYRDRIGHYMPFEIVTIPELRATASLSEAQQKEKEGELILQKVQPADTLVLLDEHGREPRSVELAAWLEKKRTTARRLVFAIGGPYGFSLFFFLLSFLILLLSLLFFPILFLSLLSFSFLFFFFLLLFFP